LAGGVSFDPNAVAEKKKEKTEYYGSKTGRIGKNIAEYMRERNRKNAGRKKKVELEIKEGEVLTRTYVIRKTWGGERAIGGGRGATKRQAAEDTKMKKGEKT